MDRWIMRLVVLALISGPAAQGAIVEDQAQRDNTGWNRGVIEPGKQQAAQTFKPGMPGYLHHVSVLINYWSSPYGSPGDLVIEIRKTDSGAVAVYGGNQGYSTGRIPTEEIVASDTVASMSIPANQQVWTDVIFDRPPLLDSAETYAIVAYTTTPECSAPHPDYCPGGGYYWYTHGSNFGPDFYVNGESMARAVGTSWFWSVARPYDFLGVQYTRYDDQCFATYMEPPPTIGGLLQALHDSLVSIDPPGANGLLNKIGNIEAILVGADQDLAAGRITMAEFADAYQAALDILLVQFTNQLQAKIDNGQIPEPTASSLLLLKDRLQSLLEEKIRLARA